MNGYQRWVLNGIKQHCPQLFERITGMTPDAFERAYNPKDEQFCKRMKQRHDAFKAESPQQYAQAEAGARQFFSELGGSGELNNNNPTKLERTQDI